MVFLKAARRFFSSKPGKIIGGALDITTAAFTDPLTFVTKGRSKAVRKFKKRGSKKNIARILGTTATAASFALAAPVGIARAGISRAAVSGGIRRAAPKVAATTSRALFGTPKRAIATVFGAGIISSSKTVRSAIVKAPKTIFKQGSNVGKFIDAPKDSKITTLKDTSVKDKIIKFGVGAGLVAAAAAVVIKTTPTAAKLLGKGAVAAGGLLIPDKKAPKVSDVVVQPTPPKEILAAQTPRTQELTTTTRKKRKKKRKIPLVKQSVRVNVVNKNYHNQSRRYIKVANY